MSESSFFERPILNSPYEYPSRHWELDTDGQPTQNILEHRRRASYVTPVPKSRKQRTRVVEQQELGIGGMESNDTDPLTSLLGEDALFVNGTLVPEAFAGVNQGPREYGILSISLPASVLGSLASGNAALLIDLNSNAGLGLPSRVEPVFYDFSQLTLEYTPAVPEPASTWLALAGLGALYAHRRMRKP